MQSYGDFHHNPNNLYYFSPLPCDSLTNLRQTKRTSLIPVAKKKFFFDKMEFYGASGKVE